MTACQAPTCTSYANHHSPALKAMLCGFHARRLTTWGFDHPDKQPTSWPDWRVGEGVTA